MAIPNPQIRFTYEDYKTLPEVDTRRYELLDGDLVMVPAPTPYHQRISRDLGFELVRFARETGLGEVLYSPIDVVFGEGDEREVMQSDLIFISRERRHVVTEEEIRGAPDLVVEILSPGTEKRDRGYKKKRYARYEVKEYWIVDPKAATVEVFVLGETDYRLARRFGRSDVLISDLLPGLRVELGRIFE